MSSISGFKFDPDTAIQQSGLVPTGFVALKCDITQVYIEDPFNKARL
jgi:hypothetical protein